MANMFTLFRAEWRAPAVRPHVIGTVATVAAMLGLLAVFHDTTTSFVRIWTTSVIYGHGLLIPVLAGFLAHQRRAAVVRQPVRPAALLGGAGLALAGLIWLAGDVTATRILEHAGLVGMLQSTVLLVLGVRITLALAVPLAYLVLAIPFGDSLVPSLQDITAKGTTELLRATGVPVYMADWKMITPDGTFLVARVCAGLQYILACLAIGGLIAGMWYRTPWKRAVVLAIAVAVPVGANVLRAYGIVMLAHLISFEAASGVAHVVYGFVFLSLISLGFIVLAARFRERGVPASAVSNGTADASDASENGHVGSTRLVLTSGFAVAFALGLAGTADALNRPAATTGSAAELAPPAVTAGWRPGPDTDGLWTPIFRTEPSARETWAFTDGRRRVGVTLARFGGERGADIVGLGLFDLGAENARVMHRGRVAPTRVPEHAPPASLRIRVPDGSEHLVWYWYAIGGELTGDPVTAKLYQLLARIRSEPSRPRLIVLSTPASDDDAATLTRLVGNLDLHDAAAPAASPRE